MLAIAEIDLLPQPPDYLHYYKDVAHAVTVSIGTSTLRVNDSFLAYFTNLFFAFINDPHIKQSLRHHIAKAKNKAVVFDPSKP